VAQAAVPQQQQMVERAGSVPGAAVAQVVVPVIALVGLLVALVALAALGV